MKKLHRIPDIGELGEIPMPLEYRGQEAVRIRDFLTGFQIAAYWYTTTSQLSPHHGPESPRPHSKIIIEGNCGLWARTFNGDMHTAFRNQAVCIVLL
jgi:hypothetical protein